VTQARNALRRNKNLNDIKQLIESIAHYKWATGSAGDKHRHWLEAEREVLDCLIKEQYR
jgi:hypothetical protein